MALFTGNEKLTELFATKEDIININNKIIYFGHFNSWKRTETASNNFLNVDTVYTKAESNYAVGKFIYNESGDLYVISDGNGNEYCYYVKSFDETTNTIVVTYDTYSNIKNGQYSDSYPLGVESITYVRDTENDKTL